MLDIEKAIKNPSSIFDDPLDLVKSDELTKEEKIKVLKSWRYDAKQMSVATEENMPGNNNDILSKVMEALNILGVAHSDNESKTTK